MIDEFDQPAGSGSSLLPLEAGVYILCVLAEDNDVKFLRILHRRGHAFVPAHRTLTNIEVENLAQRYVERANAAAHWSGQRAFNGHTKFLDGVNGVLRQPVVHLAE